MQELKALSGQLGRIQGGVMTVLFSFNYVCTQFPATLECSWCSCFYFPFFQIMNDARPTVCRSAERRMKLEQQRAAKDKQRAVSATKSPCIE